MTEQPDPSKVKVQLNINIPWDVMAGLDELSFRKRVPKAQLVRDALENTYPDVFDEIKAQRALRAREETRNAGSTR